MKCYVTLLSSAPYLAGCLVLGTSLRLTGTSYPLVVMVTREISQAVREHLALLFDHVVEVQGLDSGDAER